MDTDEAVRSIGDSFERIAMAARRAARRAAEQVDPELQPAGWAVYREVQRAGRVQAHELVATTGMDKSAVSRQLKELRRLGLVEAERDDRDARAFWISPSARAVERADAAGAARWNGMRDRLATWDPADLERFAVLLDRFADPEWLRDEGSRGPVR